MSGGKDARSERLKAALRANLRRRKEQGRGRTESRDAPEAEQPGPPETDSPGPDSDKSGL